MELYKLDDITEGKFFRLPKELFENKFYNKKLDSNAKILYSILLDRMELSRKNEWVNKEGEIYLLYTREDIMKIMGLSKPTVTKAFKSLEKVGLIYEIRQGLNLPNIIFIGKIKHDTAENAEKSLKETSFTSRPKNPSTQKEKEVYSIYTNNNYTEIINTIEEDRTEDMEQDFVNDDFKKIEGLFSKYLPNIKIINDSEIKFIMDSLKELGFEYIEYLIINVYPKYKINSFGYIRKTLSSWKNNNLTLDDIKRNYSNNTNYEDVGVSCNSDIDYQRIINDFKSICAELPNANKDIYITSIIKKQISHLFSQGYNYDEFEKVFKIASKGSFFHANEEDNKDFFNFTWLIQQRNFEKILNDCYRDYKNSNVINKQSQSIASNSAGRGFKNRNVSNKQSQSIASNSVDRALMCELMSQSNTMDLDELKALYKSKNTST